MSCQICKDLLRPNNFSLEKLFTREPYSPPKKNVKIVFLNFRVAEGICYFIGKKYNINFPLNKLLLN